MVTNGKIRVFLIDSERMWRDTLLAMFNGWGEMDVLGASADLSEPLEPADNVQPDAIVINLAGTRAANVAALKQSLLRWPRAKIVVLSPFSNKAFVAEVLRAGAHGYVTMQCAFDELLEAVRTVTAGSTYLCSRIRQSIVDGFAREGTDAIGSDGAIMTDREGTILQLFGEGQSSKEIAARLNLSSKTIDACRRQLMQKLDVDSTAGLVKCAIALGLTTADPWPARSR